MQMTKNQMVMASIGGVAGAISLVLLVMVFMRSGDIDKLKAEKDALAGTVAGLEGEGASRKVGMQNKQAYESLKQGLDAALINPVFRADKDYDIEKTKLQAQIHDDDLKLKNWKIIDSTFEFPDFKEYIAGKTPNGDLWALNRQWSDVCAIMEIMHKANVAKVIGVKVVKKSDNQQEQKNSKPKKGSNNKKAKDASRYTLNQEEYVFTIKVRPSALVEVVNALTNNKDNFFVISKLNFGYSEATAPDVIKNAITGDDKKGKNKKKNTDALLETQPTEEVAQKTYLANNPNTVDFVEAQLTIKSVIVKPGSKENAK